MLRLQDAFGKNRGLEFLLALDQARDPGLGKSRTGSSPHRQFADYTALNKLEKVTLKTANRHERRGEESDHHVSLENPSKNLAFFVRLKVNKGAEGEEIVPVIWEDNYISLLPGEKRELTATYRAAAIGTAKPTLKSAVGTYTECR